MREQGAKDTRDALAVMIENMRGADRVVIETKNAIGEMDAHYMHAPSILEAWDRRFTAIKANTD